jgi:hypothetical protein
MDHLFVEGGTHFGVPMENFDAHARTYFGVIME